MSQETPRGTQRTREFYDEEGWTTDGTGTSVDEKLFGSIEDGPIRRAAFSLQVNRIRDALGENLNLLEAGCGGSPAQLILDRCSSYTGVDFSERGVALARQRLRKLNIPHHVLVADFTALPFADNTFDAVYCAHALYHIDSPEGQAAALADFMRVVRPGGVVVLLVANPFPLAGPVRALARLVATMPVLSTTVRAFRKPAPLPYRPMSIGWMRRQLVEADIRVITAGMASTSFNRNVSEHKSIGRAAWRVIQWLERDYPELSAYLGTFVQIEARKRA